MTEPSTTDTVEKRRFDGLMSAHQKALSMLSPEQRAALKGEPAPDAGAQDQDLAGNGQGTEDSQHTNPGYEDGDLLEYRDGAIVPFEPPTPFRHNGQSRSIAGKPKDRPYEDVIADLDRQVGKPSKMTWDIAKH